MYKVVSSIAPLGSSLMFPIYFLNVPVIGFGEPRMEKLMREQWAWHVDVGCHASRILPVDYLSASRAENHGYVADLDALPEMLRRHWDGHATTAPDGNAGAEASTEA